MEICYYSVCYKCAPLYLLLSRTCVCCVVLVKSVRMFHVQEGYSSKLKRDDLEHTIGLDVHSEEVKKPVPILSSSVYGHPGLNQLESPERKYVRVATVKKEFYRSCGADATLKQ